MPVRLQSINGRCSGSPSRPSRSPSPPGSDFPERLRMDLDDYFAGLARSHRTLNGKRIQPCSSGTIRTAGPNSSRWRAWRFGSACRSRASASLGALLHPDVVEKVIDAYWEKNGEEPKTGTIDLGKKVLRMARETGCLDQAALDRLDEMRAALEHHRREGMTPKNLQLVRQVLTEGVWSEVVSLPSILMQQARSAKDHAPIKAGISAQLAAAIAILTFAPVRLSNLVTHRAGREPHQAGRIEHAVLARLPALRCEEPRRSEFQVRSAPD